MRKTPLTEPPAWVRDAIFYQIFPDRFAMSAGVDKPQRLEPWDAAPTRHGYKGGDLLGVVERLDHLVDLGITAIYFNPIFQSASNHRYHTHDYFAVDPLLGGNEAFDELLDACRARGIRVVLDGVFNHASRGFLQFSDVAENGPKSPYWDWFHVHNWPVFPYDDDRPNHYEAWWGIKALPKFNTENPDVREYLMQVVEHWTRRGIDGWRLDVPEEIKTEGFWEEFRRRVRSINPDAYIVGEIWSDASNYVGDGARFDATMNYELGTAIIGFVGGRRIDDSLRVDNPWYDISPIDAGGFAARIAILLERYRAETTLANLNLLDSHDTARVASLFRGDTDAVLVAALLLLSFPGAPCLYYGTEVGLEGGLDPDCRRGFPWDRTRWDPRLHDAFRALIALRRTHPSLRSRHYDVLHAEGGGLVVKRTEAEETVYVVANTGDSPSELPIGEATEVLWGNADVKDGVALLGERNGALLR